MNRNMVVAEWNRARESLRAAETLTRDGLYADAISRAYYAIRTRQRRRCTFTTSLQRVIPQFGECLVFTL